MSVERVLLVHDEERGVEHFVREVAFSNVTERFGFVVPLPSLPSVSPVSTSPFAALERWFVPFDLWGPGSGAGSGQGFGSGSGRLGGLHIHEAKRVGSFASYVLSATDPHALTKWLKQNQFETTPASAEWIARYVRRGFYFVALRFEPSLAKERHWGSRSSETLRMTFESPVPYYPYEEPERDDLEAPRALVVWLVTRAPKVPIAFDGERYVRPWREGKRFADQTAAALSDVLGKELWKAVAPESGPWLVQTFEDQKTKRSGFGDVVLVPEARTPLDDAAFEKRRRLLPLLDPALGAP